MFVPCVMIICLTVTILMELLIAFVLQVRDKKDFVNITLANVLTNPLLISTSYLVFFKFGSEIVLMFEIIMEIVIFIVEGVIYNKYLKYRKINPYIVSIILNLFSYFVGSIIIDKIISMF